MTEGGGGKHCERRIVELAGLRMVADKDYQMKWFFVPRALRVVVGRVKRG